MTTKLKYSGVMMAITITADSRSELSGAKVEYALDLFYLAGNFELLVGETFLTIGPFEGAVLLLPSLEVLAEGIRRFREGGTRYEVHLIGDVGSLWLLRHRGHETMDVAFDYRGQRTQPVLMKEFDEAAEQATREFIDTVIAAYPLERWSVYEIAVLRELALTWPSFEPLVQSVRHLWTIDSPQQPPYHPPRGRSK